MYALKTKNQESVRILEEAFEKFNQAGLKLEAKYKELLLETESLRERLRLKEEEVRKTEKLALLGETAAALAHEVRNPLGAIKLFISMLKSDVADRPEALQLIAQIDRGVNSLDNIVSNILQFSKNEKVKLSPVNVHSIISEQVSGFKAAQGAKAAFDVSLQGNPFVNANEHGLRQVFHNLILNALQATRFAGRIGISAADDGGRLKITVTDNGPGIPDEVKTRIFEPFVTTKNEGTGLGLAVVSQIIRQHAGEIQAANDQGACFEISLNRSGIAG